MLKSQARRQAPLAFGPVARAQAKGAVEWAFEGLALADRGDRVRGLQCFERALEIDIDCTEAWLGLSEIFLSMQDARRADACLRVAQLIRRRTAPEATA